MGVTTKAGSSQSRLTPEGGRARLYINDTGAPSVRGTVVETSDTVDNAVDIIGADEPHPIGVMEHDGIPNGALCWVVISGPAYVLLKNSTTATRGYWVRSSDTDAGRADATNASPPGGTVNALEGHFREIGHAMESVTAGTDKLALVHLHFN